MYYDICDPDIRCNADKDGATVFEVPRGRRTLRVLTFDLQRAEEIVRDQEAESAPTSSDESWLF
ncbi:hypothetical protein ACXR0O_28105 [Verrucomicrobiota bacterium sgz303538]